MKGLIKSNEVPQTTLMILKQCSEDKKIFNEISKIEQTLTVRESIKTGELMMKQGAKYEVVAEIIKVVEFYLEVTGKELEEYQIRILAGDLYDKFRTDTIEDIILMFKMIRTGDLGKLGFYDTFHEKIMAYVPLFLDHKAEEREKLINLQKRKINEKLENVQMSDEAYAKFTELHNRIAKPIEKSANVFSIKKALNSMDDYLETLPETCKKLSYSDLKYELRRTQQSNKIAHEILLQEFEKRPKSKKTKMQ